MQSASTPTLSQRVDQLSDKMYRCSAAAYAHAATSRDRLAAQHQFVKDQAVRTRGDAFVQSVADGYYATARLTRALFVPATRTLDFVVGNQRRSGTNTWRSAGLLGAAMVVPVGAGIIVSGIIGALTGAAVGAGVGAVSGNVGTGACSGAEVGCFAGVCLLTIPAIIVVEIGSLMSAACKQAITTLGGIPGAIMGALVGLARVAHFVPNNNQTIDEKLACSVHPASFDTPDLKTLPAQRLHFLESLSQQLYAFDVRDLARHIAASPSRAMENPQTGEPIASGQRRGVYQAIARDPWAQRIVDGAGVDQWRPWLKPHGE